MSDTTSPGNLALNQHDQFLRKAEVILVSGSAAYSFNETFSFVFRTTQTENFTYNTATVRIRNLSEKTINDLVGKPGKEFSRIYIKAGYVPPGNYGTIFQGTITQYAIGRESNVNTYLDVFASDGDLMNYAVAAQTVAGPADQAKIIAALGQVAQQQAGVQPIDPKNLAPQNGGVVPRGKVMWGWSLPYLRALGKQRQSTFSIQNGQLVEIPLTGYAAGDIVVINSHTGMIGMPEITQQGITARCLLNPKIFIGQRVKINNGEVNRTVVTNRVAAGPKSDIATSMYASTAADGIYRVCVVEATGETRGTPWYTDLVLLAIDPSADPANSVSLTGNGG